MFVTSRKPKFSDHWITLNIYSERGSQMFLSQVCGPHHIEKRVTGTIQLREFGLRESPTGAFAIGEPKGPLIGQSNAIHALGNVSYRVRTVICDRVPLWVIGPDRIIFYIPDFMTEPTEPTKPVQIEPGLPTKRTTSHHPQNDQP
jgi:hypothetical protein